MRVTATVDIDGLSDTLLKQLIERTRNRALIAMERGQLALALRLQQVSAQHSRTLEERSRQARRGLLCAIGVVGTAVAALVVDWSW